MHPTTSQLILALALLAPASPLAKSDADPSGAPAPTPTSEALPSQHVLMTLASGRTVKSISMDKVPALVGKQGGVLATYLSDAVDAQADTERAELFEYVRLTAEAYGEPLIVLAAIPNGRGPAKRPSAAAFAHERGGQWRKIAEPPSLPAWTLGGLRFAGPKADPAGTAAVARLSRQWLEQMDAGAYESAWAVAAPELRARMPRTQWIETWTATRSRLRTTARSPLSLQVALPPPGLLRGPAITAEYLTEFGGGLRAVEIVTATVAGDGTWRVVGYVLRPQPG